MYDQASTEKHSREDESKLLCNAVAKKEMGSYVDSKRLRSCMTSACEETMKLLKQGQLYTFARVYYNHTIILYSANCSYCYQSFLWPIFNQIQHTYIHIVCIVPFYQ